MEKPLTGYLNYNSITTGLVDILKVGGVAVLPTDTIYGLHCVAGNSGSVRRIRNIKGGGERTGFVLLASYQKMVYSLITKWPLDSRGILERLWPAPLTALLPAREDLPGEITRERKVAVRIPRLKALREIIDKVGEPLVSTSVNMSGYPPMRAMGEIKDAFPGLDAYISVRGRHGRYPSTVVDFTVNPPLIIRMGYWEKCWNRYIDGV